MSDSDRPLLVLLEELLPIGIVLDIKKRLFKPDWESFFTSLFSVGLIFLLISAFSIIILYLVLMIAIGGSGPVETLTAVLKSISFMSIIAYVFLFIILKGVESVIQGEPPLTDTVDFVEDRFGGFQDNRYIRGLFLIVNIIVYSLLVDILIRFRISLIISDFPQMSGLFDISWYLVIILALLFDLAYIGLVLAVVGQTYNLVTAWK